MTVPVTRFDARLIALFDGLEALYAQADDTDCDPGILILITEHQRLAASEAGIQQLRLHLHLLTDAYRYVDEELLQQLDDVLADMEDLVEERDERARDLDAHIDRLELAAPCTSLGRARAAVLTAATIPGRMTDFTAAGPVALAVDPTAVFRQAAAPR